MRGPWGRAMSGGVCSFVSVCVRALKGKLLELPTPNLVYIFSMVVARHKLTQRSTGQRSRSHGYENRHDRMAASVKCAAAAVCCCCCRRGTARRMTA